MKIKRRAETRQVLCKSQYYIYANVFSLNLQKTNAEDEIEQVLLTLRNFQAPDYADREESSDDIADKVDSSVCIP
jgi:hypothetical protein